jgi:hypothetical protein
MEWDIGREGRDWLGADGLAKLEQLPGRLELMRGKLCWNADERHTLLAGLLENVGLDEVVRLANLEDWQQALAARAEAERASVDVDAGSMPKSHWNCRVIETPLPEGERWYEVHEVHYEQGRPIGYAASPATLGWSSEDEPGAGSRRLEQLRTALCKPVLKESDFKA